ncbi:MAG: hypothetical protein GXO81_03650 [Chlorobi bacterium]|nr:hypothetical protein [Chlorobiota bacterium]
MKRTLKLFSQRNFKYGIAVFVLNFIVAGSLIAKGRGDTALRLPWSLGVNVSTFGPGVDLSKPLSEKVNLRIGYNYFSYDYPLAKLDNELQGDAVLQVGGPSVSIEYYIFRKLYLSGGLKYNQVNVGINGQMSESVFIGDIEMYPEEIGNVSLSLGPEYRIVPYAGLGFGGGITNRRRVSLAFELGVFYHGKPQVSLTTTGMLEPTSSKEQEALIEKNISPLEFWPVITFRLSYKFTNYRVEGEAAK